MKPPAFQFYPDDFVAGCAILSTEEIGAYMLLLCHQWSTGGVPDDEVLIRRIAKVTQAFPLGLLLAKFERVDGQLKNRRLESERQKQDAFRQKQSENGKLGGRPKGLGNPGLTQALSQTKSQTKAKKSSPSPSPINTPLPPEGEASPWEVAFGLELPESLRTPECLEAVKTWLAYKTEKRKGYKSIGLKGAMKAWSEEFTPQEFPAAVRYSISKNWEGIFKPDNKPSANGKPAVTTSGDEIWETVN